MNSKIIAILLILTCSISQAHHISTASVHYTVEPIGSASGTAIYDIAHGMLQYTDGATKRFSRAHMARLTPWNAQEIIGKITVDLANEFAGTWYIYR
ncbi:MAG: hypothetical protein AB7F19_04925 [Candidatus Babeliales bacterium]